MTTFQAEVLLRCMAEHEAEIPGPWFFDLKSGTQILSNQSNSLGESEKILKDPKAAS